MRHAHDAISFSRERVELYRIILLALTVLLIVPELKAAFVFII
jgi:hypothetical protein